MARIEEMVGVGVPAEQAKAISGGSTVDADVTATGDSSQADSYAILAATTRVTGGGATTGVRLPANAQVGDTFMIGNASDSNCLVYPPVGGNINGAGANTAITLTNAHGILARRVDGTHWIAVTD